MKKLIAIIATIIAMANIALTDIGGHDKYSATSIALTSVGAYSAPRVALSFVPIKSKTTRIAVNAIGGFATAQTLAHIANKMHTPGCEADHRNMSHNFKDGSMGVAFGIQADDCQPFLLLGLLPKHGSRRLYECFFDLRALSHYHTHQHGGHGFGDDRGVFLAGVGAPRNSLCRGSGVCQD